MVGIVRVALLSLAVAATPGIGLPVTAQQMPSQVPRSETVQERVRSSLFRLIPAEGPISNRGGIYQVAHMAGREDLTIAAMQSTQPCVATGQDPISAIVAGARKTNIVMINEDHGSPLHRQFIADLLAALRPEGYSIYAAEAFANGIPRHLPLSASDGYYSQEPVFGRTVQLAKSLGYQLVAYEQTPAQMAEAQQEGMDPHTAREEAQKDNLIAEIFRDHSTAKVVIHVGGAHLLERPVRSQGNVRWMAARLIEATGVDPLTISQLGCLSDGRSSVLAVSRRNGDEITTAETEGVDLFVGHPPLEFRRHRPVWRWAAGDIEVEIPEALRSETQVVIVEARVEGATSETVPADRILIRPHESIPLLLPPGRYRLDAFVPGGRLNSERIAVDVNR